jgi:anti-sigma factor ChrR (cupin superfamily)
MNNERLIELAASFASGEIAEAERGELFRALETASAEARHQVAETIDVGAALSMRIAPEKPSASLRDKVLAQTLNGSKAAPLAMSEALTFMSRAAETGWTPMKVPGAFVKLLSMNPQRGYAVALGKLDPGTHYPAHVHQGPEEILMLTGDLWIGEKKLTAGDFHHAGAGSRHEINHSESGCTILIVLTTEDLAAQMA